MNHPPAHALSLIGTDWSILNHLFADENAAFRHHMGISRGSTRDFYAPSAQAEIIQKEKAAILASPEASQYLLDSTAGMPAFENFASVIEGSLPTRSVSPNVNAQHKNITLALEPDWLLLLPPDWILVWASVCFPTRWSLAGKAMLPLADIHHVVPKLQQELGRKIALFFDRLIPGDGWNRANWGLSSSAELNQHPTLPYTPLSNQTPLENMFIRIESQHLFKMSETGAIAFAIRIMNFPLAEVLDRPAILHGLTTQLRTMPEEVAAYKGIPEDFWRRL